MYWVAIREATRHPTKHSQPPLQQGVMGPKCQQADVKKPCPVEQEMRMEDAIFSSNYL